VRAGHLGRCGGHGARDVAAGEFSQKFLVLRDGGRRAVGIAIAQLGGDVQALEQVIVQESSEPTPEGNPVYRGVEGEMGFPELLGAHAVFLDRVAHGDDQGARFGPLLGFGPLAG
jgi:hypothetical protein